MEGADEILSSIARLFNFNRPKNRPKKEKPASSAGFMEIRADRTGLLNAVNQVDYQDIL